MTHTFLNFEPVCCSMSNSNCCLFTSIHVSQEAGKGGWYSHLFKNSPQFVMIHTVKGFGIVNKAEIDVFLELSCFFHDPADVSNLISGFVLLLSCPTLCGLMDSSRPKFPVLHCLLELAQAQVHRVGDAIKPSYSLSHPSLPAFDLSQHQSLFH